MEFVDVHVFSFGPEIPLSEKLIRIIKLSNYNFLMANMIMTSFCFGKLVKIILVKLYRVSC